ncbi:MAG: immunoglobulin domain-containing protein, partial [Ignavibacteriae bacterium]|nr:immunoglobulin domain-containing protein [Ignavibacteriota bacterium]
TGIIFQYLTSQAPLFTLNNIIDFVGTNSYAALRYEESEVNRGGADYNIYINNNKSSTEAQIGSNIASWFRYGSTNFMIGTNEKYNTNPNWSNINNKIFAASIGPDGVNIPDLRVAIGGNANDKGMAYNLIGDSFNGHKVGFDPDGRSFAYDILGNLRTTNDIGAIGTSGESVIITPESKSITPSITSQPINVTVENGTDATLSIEASCSDAIGYQWWKTPYISDSESKITESSKFVGVTSNRLTIKNIDLNDADISYICEVYNTKDPSNLWVNSNPVSIQITSDNSVDNNDPINIDNGLKVFLEALYDNNKMNSSLYNVKVFPLKQPYNVNPWNLDDNALISEVKPDYVAWIYVELRDNLTSSSYRKSAILTSDGSVLNPDGTDFSFSNIASGSYYVAIHHRNHLSIMSSVPVPISNQKIINYDFTSSSSSAYGSNSLVGLKGGKFGMFAGDADANGVINNLDFGIVANKIPFKGYASGDLDMNGIINVLDYSFINKNILKKSNLP